MKKIFTLFALALAVFSAKADDTFAFCYKDGTVIPNGSVVNVATSDPAVIEEGFGMLESGVFVKNTKSTDELATLSFDVKSLSNGSSLMVCLGTNCHNYEVTGPNAISDVTLKAGSVNDLMTHWSAYTEDWETFLPGSCSVEMTIQHAGANCSTITINFAYGENANVQGLNASQKVVGCYSLTGAKVSANQKGVIIQKMADGSIRKVINK